MEVDQKFTLVDTIIVVKKQTRNQADTAWDINQRSEKRRSAVSTLRASKNDAVELQHLIIEIVKVVDLLIINKMSEIRNKIAKNCNQEELFPLHLYQNTRLREGTQQFLDENLHDQPLTQTYLHQAKQSLKIGEDTSFETPIDKFGSKIL